MKAPIGALDREERYREIRDASYRLMFIRKTAEYHELGNRWLKKSLT